MLPEAGVRVYYVSLAHNVNTNAQTLEQSSSTHTKKPGFGVLLMKFQNGARCLSAYEVCLSSGEGFTSTVRALPKGLKGKATPAPLQVSYCTLTQNYQTTDEVRSNTPMIPAGSDVRV